MRVAIVGTRRPPVSYEQWEAAYGRLILSMKPDTVVSGGAVGIDAYARRYVEKHSLRLLEFKPEYSKYGRGAPLVRNTTIVENADIVLAFTYGASRGTLDTINKAKKMKKYLKVIEL